MARILVNEVSGPLASTQLDHDVVEVSGRGVFNLESAVVDVFDTVYTRFEINREVNVTTGDAFRLISDDTGSHHNRIVVGKGAALRAENGFNPIISEGDNDYIRNRGELTGGSGITMYGDQARIVNSGLIRQFDLGSAAIHLESSATGASVSNSGKIIGVSQGIVIEADYAEVENSGLIKGGMGIFLYGAHGSIENSGKILQSSNGIYVSDAPVTLVNDGVISSYLYAVYATFGGVFENSGVLRSDSPTSFFVGAEASLTNSGKIFKDVELSLQSDFFENTGKGFVSGTVWGLFGNDELIGGRKDDTLNGGGNDDLIRGGGGDDLLLGETGQDDLFGDAGRDTIDGGDGNDRMNGGTGNDRLTGGANFDVFEFTGKRPGRDVITDFEVGADEIDLSAYDIDYATFFDRAVSERGGNTVINLNKIGGGVSGKIILLGVEVNQESGFSISDFGDFLPVSF